MRLAILAPLMCMALALTGCAGANYGGMSPVQAEQRVVSEKADDARTAVLYEPMVYLDQGPLITPSHGIRLPSGTYALEAEDSDNLYYGAPAPIEYRTFGNDGKVNDQRFMLGGIYFSKAAIALVPAGAYMSVDQTHKVLTWRLGGEFSRLEGSKWIRTGQK